MNKKWLIIILASIILLGMAVLLWWRLSHVSVKPPVAPSTSTAASESNAELRDEIQKVLSMDADLDGLSNEEEKKYGTNSRNPDTDGDGLLDSDEIKVHHSDPLKADTNGDGVSDGQAVRQGQNPITGNTLPIERPAAPSPTSTTY